MPLNCVRSLLVLSREYGNRIPIQSLFPDEEPVSSELCRELSLNRCLGEAVGV